MEKKNPEEFNLVTSTVQPMEVATNGGYGYPTASKGERNTHQV